MRVLIVGDAGRLRNRLVSSLSSGHHVRSLEPGPGAEGPEVLAAASDVVVYLPPASGTMSDHELVWRVAEEIYRLMTALPKGGRFVLIGSLRIFESCPVEWRVTEDYRPRPTAEIGDLVVHLAETAVREIARARPVRGVVLRCGDIVGDGAAPDPRAVHMDDVVRAVACSLDFEPPEGYLFSWPMPDYGWWAFHVVGAGRTQRVTAGVQTERVLGFTPEHDVSGGIRPKARPHAAPEPVASRTIRNVAIFGAWGPLGAVVAESLGRDFKLRLCDRRTFEEAYAGPAATRGDPPPRRVAGKHEERVVDVTDPAQVLAAADGMDALVNLTVNRRDPHLAFGVNTAGAFNLATAAIRCGIRRIVQTGPEQISDHQQGGHWPDFAIPETATPRPGARLYFLSKFLGTETLRLFAETHGLEVPTLLFGHLRRPQDTDPDSIEGMPIAVSWEDAAEAVRCALTVPAFPEAQQVFNVVADLPHDKLRNDAAKRILGWAPRDGLEMLWTRTFD